MLVESFWREWRVLECQQESAGWRPGCEVSEGTHLISCLSHFCDKTPWPKQLKARFVLLYKSRVPPIIVTVAGASGRWPHHIQSHEVRNNERQWYHTRSFGGSSHLSLPNRDNSSQACPQQRCIFYVIINPIQLKIWCIIHGPCWELYKSYPVIIWQWILAESSLCLKNLSETNSREMG